MEQEKEVKSNQKLVEFASFKMLFYLLCINYLISNPYVPWSLIFNLLIDSYNCLLKDFKENWVEFTTIFAIFVIITIEFPAFRKNLRYGFGKTKAFFVLGIPVYALFRLKNEPFTSLALSSAISALFVLTQINFIFWVFPKHFIGQMKNGMCPVRA